jgi:hypothetical protein
MDWYWISSVLVVAPSPPQSSVYEESVIDLDGDVHFYGAAEGRLTTAR